MEKPMKYYEPILLIVLICAYGCAPTKPSKRSPFIIVEGKKIGVLEFVVDESFKKKTKDSVDFDNKYLNNRQRIGFKYPGKDISYMKIYNGEKLLKTCDEGSYARNIEKDLFETNPGMGGGSSFGPSHWDTKMKFNGDGLRPPEVITTWQEGTTQKDKIVYVIKYNLECEVNGLKEGAIIELYDSNGLVTKYQMISIDDLSP